MPKHSPAGNQQNDSRQERWLRRLDRWVIPVLLLALVGGLPGCLFKKKKAAAPTMIQQGPIRIVFLPANIAAEDTGQRWLSLAVPVLLTKLATLSPDLEPVPLWQLLLSAGLLYLTAWLVFVAASNAFHAQNLLSGKAFSFGRYFRAMAGRLEA